MKGLRAFALIVLGLLIGSWGGRADDAHGQASSFRILGPGIVSVGEIAYAIDDGGPIAWRQMPFDEFTLPPVPVSSIALYEAGIVITDGGEGWYRIGTEWTSLGVFPGGPDPVRNVTLGQIKAKYR